MAGKWATGCKAFPVDTQPQYITDTQAYWPIDHRCSKYKAMDDTRISCLHFR